MLQTTAEARRPSSSRYPMGASKVQPVRDADPVNYVEPRIFEHLDYPGAEQVIEVGCGGGGRIEMLLRQFPGLSVTGIDHREVKICRASARLAAQIEQGRATVTRCPGDKTPFPSGWFDGALLCWPLEQIAAPLDVLREMHRVMSDDGILHATEIFHASFHAWPECPAICEFYARSSRWQAKRLADPSIGIKLRGLLGRAGFREIETRLLPFRLDRTVTDPAERARVLGSCRALIASALPGLLFAGQVDEALLKGVQRELNRLEDDPHAALYFVVGHARAVK